MTLSISIAGNKMKRVMEKIRKLLFHANDQVRLKAMHSLAEFVQIPAQEASKHAPYLRMNLINSHFKTRLTNIRYPSRRIGSASLTAIQSVCS